MKLVKNLIFGCMCCAIIMGTIGQVECDLDVVKGELGAKIDEYLTRITPFGFSGAALVAKNGEVILNKGYGMAIRSEKMPNTSKTVFSTGSITKQFTAAAIMKLEMQGKLNTNGLITEYFDSVPQDKSAITLHHLLTHTSGLVQDVGMDYDVAPRDETVEKMLAQPLEFDPGERFEYTNVGYSLLAAIVEHVSGQSYEEFLDEHLFKPAGMSFTGYRKPDWDQRVVAHWYVGAVDNGIALDKPYPYWNLMGNGGILSTTEDMYKWHLALLGNDILSEDVKKKLYTPFLNEYAYGWDVMDSPHGTLIKHDGGSTLGNAAEIRRYTDADIVIIVFCNADGGEVLFEKEVREKIEALVFGLDVEIPPQVLQHDTDYLKQFIGTYTLPTDGQVDVSLQGNALIATTQGQDAIHMLAFSDDADLSLHNDLNKRTQAIFEAAVKNDYSPFEVVLANREERYDRVREFINMRIDRYKDQTGSIESVHSLGTLPSSFEEGAVETAVELRGERGSIYFLSIWKDGQNIGVAPVRRAQGLTVPCMPVSNTEFAGYDLGMAKNVSLRFETDDAGHVTRLAVPGPLGELFASKQRNETGVDLTVDDLIRKHIDARGGYERLKFVQSQKIEQRIPLGSDEVLLTVYKKRPNLYRVDQQMPHGIVVSAVNSENAWMQMGQRSPMQRPGFAADHQRESVADFDGILVDFKEKGHTVEIVGVEDVEGTETIRVKVGLAGGADQYVFLDKHTFLMKKQIRTAYTPQGKIEVEDVYDDYREVEGVMLPFLIHSQQGPQRFDIRTTSVEFNVPVDEKLFIMPKKDVRFSNSDELDVFLEKQTAEGKFSGVVLIAKDGVSAFHKAYGFASKRFKVPNKPDTKFNIGSINKMFTSVAILQLCEQGKLILDDPIGNYLSGFPFDVSENVTVRHLLQHRSGWGHYWEDETYLATWTDLRTIDDYIEFIKDTPLGFEPGTSEQYSNTGFVVLGAIVEKVSGQSYYDYVREHIYKPAGMDHSDSYEMDMPVENLAIGYTNMSPFGPEEGYQRENIFLHSAKGTSAGGGYSTAEDLLKFDMVLRNDLLLSPSYTDLLFNRFNEPEEPRSRSGRIGFAGGAPGINGILEMNFDSGYTVIVLSNYDPPVAMDLAPEIMDMVSK